MHSDGSEEKNRRLIMSFNIFKSIAEILKPASDIVDEVITSKEEKLQVKNQLETIKNQMAIKMLEYETKLYEAQAKIIHSETVGSWLQRSWRPIIMLMFGFIIVYEYFISSVLGLPKANLPVDFWDLLKIGFGGYVVGRSAEKIAPHVAASFKKNRN